MACQPQKLLRTEKQVEETASVQKQLYHYSRNNNSSHFLHRVLLGDGAESCKSLLPSPWDSIGLQQKTQSKGIPFSIVRLPWTQKHPCCNLQSSQYTDTRLYRKSSSPKIHNEAFCPAKLNCKREHNDLSLFPSGSWGHISDTAL